LVFGENRTLQNSNTKLSKSFLWTKVRFLLSSSKLLLILADEFASAKSTRVLSAGTENTNASPLWVASDSNLIIWICPKFGNCLMTFKQFKFDNSEYFVESVALRRYDAKPKQVCKNEFLHFKTRVAVVLFIGTTYTVIVCMYVLCGVNSLPIKWQQVQQR